MHNKVVSLLVCIRAEKDLIEDLTVSALQKKTAIIAGDIAGLNELMRQENICVHELEKLEGQRISAIDDIAHKIGIPADSTATDFIEALRDSGEGNWAEMGSLIKDLTRGLERLKEYNALNASLLEQSLAFLENMQAMITRQRETTYSVKGSLKESGNRHLLDKTV